MSHRDRNFQRRLSATNPTIPEDVPRPKLTEVQGKPFFDARYLAWRIRNPDHPLANDPDMINEGRWPRHQADYSCNIIQLYEHIEYYVQDCQMLFKHDPDTSKILIMPYMIVEPQPGWKLYDYDNNQVYTVKDVGRSYNSDKKKVFDGRVILEETSGPPENAKLRWLDPYGERDGVMKVIRIVHADSLESIVKDREASGDVHDVRGTAFVPTIAYSLEREEPGSIDNNPFGPAREIGHRVRMVVKDPDNPRITQKIWGQWLDNFVSFKIYAVGPKIANRVAVWLKNFFLMYNRVLTQLGVQRILYWSQSRDKEEERTVNDLSIRTLEYYFKLEDIQVEIEGQIASYDIQFQSLDEFDAVPWYTSEPTSEIFPTDTSGGSLYGSLNIGDDF